MYTSGNRLIILDQIVYCLFRYLVLFSFIIPQSATGLESSNLPDFSQLSNEIYSSKIEKTLGAGIMREIRQSGLFDSDLIIQEYLQYIGHRLTQVAPKTLFTYFFFPILRYDLNAFAFFGGYVAVHRGLIAETETESELAAVLAHEISHICNRHLYRSFQDQKNRMPLTIAQLIAITAIGVLGAPEALPQMTHAVLGAHVQQQINFTRAHEQEADQTGLKILAAAKFNPYAMGRFFQRMQQAYRHDTLQFDYFSTHPLFPERINDAQRRAEKFPYQQNPDSLYYSLVKSRIRAQHQKNIPYRIKQLSGLLSGLSSNRSKMPLQYELSLLYAQTHQFDLARTSIEQALQTDSDNFILQLDYIAILFELGAEKTALKHCENLYLHHPKNRAVRLTLAELFLKTNQPNRTIQLLKSYQAQNPDDPASYPLLAKAYNQVGQPIEVHRLFAHWYVLHNEFDKSEQQLNIALEKAPKKSSVTSQIYAQKARYKYLQKQEKSSF